MANQDEDKEVETVNGSLIASELIKRLPQESQERILSAISKSSPEIAHRIQENLLNFADFLTDSPRVIQTLIRESSDAELAIALTEVSEKIQTLFFDNMSGRRQEAIQLEQAQHGSISNEEIRSHQMMLLARVREIRSRTQTNLPVKKEVWA